MVARTGRTRSWRGGVVVVVSALCLLVAQRGQAQCVGDCNGDGRVVINELIIGVNIALGSSPVSYCPSFANNQGEVDIAQLIKGVNNALEGCPATPTITATEVPATATATLTPTSTLPPATVTATATGVPTGTATATATGIPTGTATATATAAPPTATATGIPTGTATATAMPVTPTATGIPTGTATATAPPATATATGLPTGTATATAPPATPTATGIPTGTAAATTTPTGVPTTTPTGVPTGTAAATLTPTPTGVPTGTAAATLTPTPTGVPTGTAAATLTPTPTGTPTSSGPPPGDAIGGRAALISSGLSGIQGLIAAVVTAATNDGGAALATGGTQGLAPPIESDDCPISGTTTQSCTETGSGANKTLSLVLGADQCVAPGPLGGSGEFSGSIAIDSNPFFLNSCSPLVFTGGAYDADNLVVVLRDASNDIALTVSANLAGTLGITGVNASCLVGSLSLTLNGSMSSLLPDGTAIHVQFENTSVMMTITDYSEACVPLAYSMKFNGPAVFTPMQGALLEVSSPEVSAPLISGEPMVQGEFAVEFINFILSQDASTSPVTVAMDGTLSSDCFGGALILDTLTPVAVAAGQVCPNSGEIFVDGGAAGDATVTYANGGVTVTPEGGDTTVYPSCLSPALLMCPAS